MIKIFLVFIFVYICFTAIALNYAKAFKVKDLIISYLENNQINSLDIMTDAQVESLSKYIDDEIIGSLNYNVQRYNICNGYPEYDKGEKVAMCHPSGIVIRKSGEAENTEGVYYTVSTYLAWDMGFLNMFTELNENDRRTDEIIGMWKISGETKLIVNE